MLPIRNTVTGEEGWSLEQQHMKHDLETKLLVYVPTAFRSYVVKLWALKDTQSIQDEYIKPQGLPFSDSRGKVSVSSS